MEAGRSTWINEGRVWQDGLVSDSGALSPPYKKTIFDLVTLLIQKCTVTELKNATKNLTTKITWISYKDTKIQRAMAYWVFACGYKKKSN